MTREEYLRRQQAGIVAPSGAANPQVARGAGNVPREARLMKQLMDVNGQISQEEAVNRPANTTYDQALDMILGGMLPLMAASPGSKENAATFKAQGTGALDLLGLLSPALALGQSTGKAISGEGFNFGQNLDEAQAVVQARKESAPYTSTAANLAINLPVGMGASKTLDTALLPFKFGARTAGQATLGAAEGAGYAYGTGQGDPEIMMGLGGLLGGVGANVPFVGSKIDKARLGAAEELLQRSGKFSGVQEGYGSEMLIAELEKLGPKATISDTSPMIRNRVVSSVTSGTDADTAGQLAIMTQSRDLPQLAQAELTDILAPNLSTAARAQTAKEVYAELQARYTTVLDAAEAKRISYKPEKIFGEIEATFGGRPAGVEANARDAVVKIVNQLTENGTVNLTPKTLLTLKRNLNEVYRGLDKSAGVLSPDAKRQIADLTSKMNKTLKETVDGYENVSKLYADEASIKNATEFAADVFKNKPGATVEDLRVAMAEMSESEKMAVGLEARNIIFSQLESGTSASVIRKVHPNKDSGALADKLAIIFGDDKANKLIDASIKLNEFRTTNALLDAARLRAGGRPVSEAGAAGLASDQAAIVDALLKGKVSSGQFYGAGRRASASVIKAGEQRVENEIARSGALQGQAAIENIRMLEEYLKRGNKFPTGAGGTTSMLGLALGNQQ